MFYIPSMQKKAAERAKQYLLDGIVDHFDIEDTSSSQFTIADLGCSTGPNTFVSMENIIQGITQTYKIKGYSTLPEFQVYFNDHISNDFNTLFLNLPSNRNYFACGVPGTFHGRLFPRASLNFVYSAFAMQWLSKAPEELNDLNSEVCNRGRIHYANAPAEVCEAYATQYAADMASFLAARAEEVAPGGLMAFIIPGRPDGTLASEYSLGQVFHIVEFCLLDMANEGIVSKEKLDLFNLPLYSPSIEELKKLIEKNGKFSIAKLEAHEEDTKIPPSGYCRAGFESIVKKHFGSEIIEELFERYKRKHAEMYHIVAADFVSLSVFVLLKRHL
ncbi:S-adenosylmethionine-dependent methyltransferase, putative [Ricinus communis]|uniref:S-adenosylmethionine-dependent methyltransferase, putative n=1 Tax=Ricinus communis TaxID=3988 RepID=B9T2Q9_RICCO|nr:S-adenosylmethionine-dependent methyltransferase, putative [Ricinus communis]